VYHWYVIRSKPQKEKWLYNQLTALEFEAYYPCLHTRDGKLHLHKSKPYFPGYLFVHVDLELVGMSVLQWIPGSVGIVTFGGEPANVPDALLQKIRHRVDEVNLAGSRFFEYLKPGDEVVIHSGPFTGYEAIFCSRLQGDERAQVLLKILADQTLRIDLPVEQLTIKKPVQSATLNR
jgi:transcriptional antiterminator RfaH